jgi:hypothetical protein
MLKDFLNIVINRLIENVSIKVLDKYKFENNNNVIMNDKVKLFYKIFNMLRRNN